MIDPINMSVHDFKKIVVASHNQGKVREIGNLLSSLGIEVVSAKDLNLLEPEETGQRFIENAELKAVAAAKASGLPCLADDSGLCIACLDDEPGIYSARWAGPLKDFDLAMGLIYDRMVKQFIKNQAVGIAPDYRAKMVCALSLAVPALSSFETEEQKLMVHNFEGVVHGKITWPPRGRNGFGYDPFFTATGHHKSFGEMLPSAKHAISHRADAFRQLLAANILS